MQRKALTILLIEDSPDYAELIQTWLSARGETAFALNWTDSLAIGLNRLSQGGVDLVLLDLGLPDSEGLETFTKTRADGHNVPVIILSGGDSEPLALQMIQDGADDYLVKSTCTRDLLIKAVRYALLRRKQTYRSATDASSDQAKIIGVIGSKGGVGTTTVACNLAAELRHQTGKKVLLADLDAQAGSVSFLMSVQGKYSILDAIGIVHDLDRASWEQVVTKGADDLHVLPSPCLMGTGELQAANMRHLLTRIRPMYDWMVLDLGRLNGISAGVLAILNQVFVVTTIGIPALYEARRVIDALAKADVQGDRLRIIVNEIEETHSLSGKQLKQIFGTQVFASLPRDSEELHNSCVLRNLPGENSHIRQEIAVLARQIAGLPEKRSKRLLQPLFSFAERFRGTSKAPQLIA
jgi:Flp pilus assembly CpaE family ATPase